MPPLVSILIPAYNAEEFIADTIRSAVAQAWPRKEVIIVDDGSRDGTAAVAARFASGDVHVVQQRNQGAAAARNHALAVAQGDFIQWLDADDLLSADKVGEQMRLLDGLGPNAVASCGWGTFRYRPWAARFTPTALWHDLEPLEWLLRKWETNSHMQTATWLVSRSLSEQAGPWNAALRSDDDGEYFSRVVAKSSGVHFAQKARVYYRVSPSNRLSYIGDSDEKLEALLNGMQIQIRLVRALDDGQRTRSACEAYLTEWLPHFHPKRPDLVDAAKALAATWGGSIGAPDRASWKYVWLERLAGAHVAHTTRRRYNEMKTAIGRRCDKALLVATRRRVDVSSL
jgi:glycosyltransferase involved in cell wall biosynthesis